MNVGLPEAKCQVCDRRVLPFRKIQVEHMIWHKKCFDCVICETELSSKTATISRGKAYCSKHVPRASALQVTVNPNRDRSGIEERAMIYFHYEITGEEAERRLDKNGDFLVRWSAAGPCYFVSVKHHTNTHHVRIPQLRKGEFLYRKSVVLPLEDWVKRHVDNKMPVFGKNVFLTNPVDRRNFNRPESTSSISGDSCGTSGSCLSLSPSTESSNSAMSDDGSKLSRISTRNDGPCQISNDSICIMEADVIVNSVGSNTNLSVGALAKSIGEAGGPEMQEALNDFRRKSVKKPTYGDVIPTRGYNLRSKYVFHAILNGWRGEHNTVPDLRQILKKVFQLADEMKLTSIAIPPIGTGKLGYPKHIVAQVLDSEAADYLDTHPQSNIQRIIFAVNGEVDLLEIFMKLQAEEERNKSKEEAVSKETDIPRNQNETVNYLDIFSYIWSTTMHPPSRSLLDEVRSQTIRYPINWITMKSSQKPYDRFELDPNSTEYKDVVANMVAADGEIHTKHIAKIERIENGKFYQMYEYLKKIMNRVNGNDTSSNERILWHGTTAAAADNIISSGFNKSYVGANGERYGKGVYYAVKFSLSAHKLYSPPDPQSRLKHVFQCRVLTGNYCLGRENLLEPDFLPDEERRYDSAANKLQDPSIFVLFQDFTSYPEYLISFMN